MTDRTLSQQIPNGLHVRTESNSFRQKGKFKLEATCGLEFKFEAIGLKAGTDYGYLTLKELESNAKFEAFVSLKTRKDKHVLDCRGENIITLDKIEGDEFLEIDENEFKEISNEFLKNGIGYDDPCLKMFKLLFFTNKKLYYKLLLTVVDHKEWVQFLLTKFGSSPNYIGTTGSCGDCVRCSYKNDPEEWKRFINHAIYYYNR